MSNEWKRNKSPPPPLFLGKKERDLVKQVNDELIEKVIGQQLLYYSWYLQYKLPGSLGTPLHCNIIALGCN